MSEKFKVLPTSTFFLGIVCFIWIVYDIVKIYSDLGSVIFFDTSGLIVGIGYLLILLFHKIYRLHVGTLHATSLQPILIFIIYFKYFRHHQNNVLSVSLLSLLIISFFALIIEKIMFDEVLHEYYLEFPAPGEVHFICFGLFVNAGFILYALYCIIQEFKLTQINQSTS